MSASWFLLAQASYVAAAKVHDDMQNATHHAVNNLAKCQLAVRIANIVLGQYNSERHKKVVGYEQRELDELWHDPASGQET